MKVGICHEPQNEERKKKKKQKKRTRRHVESVTEIKKEEVRK